MFNILFLTKYSELGASSRYRIYQYLPYLKSLGFEVSVSPLFGDAYLTHKYATKKTSKYLVLSAFLKRIFLVVFGFKHYDLVVVDYEILPYFFALPERYLTWRGVNYVVDYDDAIFHNYDLSARTWIRWLFGNKIAQVMKHSSLVIAGNRYLANYAQEAGAKRVAELPTVIDLNRYPLPVQGVLTKSESVFSIGWIGSPSTAKYVEQLADVLAQVCTNGQAHVYINGATHLNLPNVPVTYIPWSSDTEVEQMHRFDVGIMPLQDSPWERGKCGFKLIQYMACGLPVVASPVGVNAEIVDEQYNGFLASSPQEWVNALTRLKQDQQLRQQMGARGRAKVELQYALQVTAPKLAALFNSLVEKVN